MPSNFQGHYTKPTTSGIRPPRPAGHAVTMLERRSTDVSAMRSSTRTGEASCSNRVRRASKTAMVADRFCEVSRRSFPFIQRVFADGGYAGEKVTTATLIAVEIVRKMRAVANQFGVDLRTAALQFSAAPDVAVSLIVGAHTEAQALANASSMKVTIPQAFWAELKRQNLIEQSAPVPEGGA